MQTSRQRRKFEPAWWTVEHTTLWQQYSAVLREDFDRRDAAAQERARMTHLGPDDVVLQKHVLTPRNVDIEHAHAVPDNDWEVGTSWEQIEPALRFGVGARAHYLRYEAWTVELEAQLRKDWEVKAGPSNWGRMKGWVRRGFESVRKPRS